MTPRSVCKHNMVVTSALWLEDTVYVTISVDNIQGIAMHYGYYSFLLCQSRYYRPVSHPTIQILTPLDRVNFSGPTGMGSLTLLIGNVSKRYVLLTKTVPIITKHFLFTVTEMNFVSFRNCPLIN